jgi:hypothetical protein
LSAAPATTDLGASPSIGDLLLRHEYVTPEKLAWAEDVHRQTGEPIGQILVEDGALSRLELASALAEQWSATSSWMPAAVPAPTVVAVDGAVDDGVDADLARELLQRVADVEAAVRSGGAPEVDALATRLDELLARIAGLETSLDVAAERHEALVAGVDDAITTHDARIDELEGRAPEQSAPDPVLLQRIEEIAVAVADVPAAQAALAAQVEQLAGSPPVAPVEVTSAIAALDLRVDELAASARGLPELSDGLRAELLELGRRVQAIQESVPAAVEEALARGAMDTAGRDDVLASLEVRLQALTGRLDDVAAAVESDVRPAAALDELAAAVEELRARPAVDLSEVERAAAESATGVAELRAGLEALDARLDQAAHGSEIAELRASVEGFIAASDVDGGVASAELAGRMAGLAERVDQLAHRVDETSTHEATEELRATVEALAAKLADDPVGGVVDALQARLDELAAAAAAERASTEALGATVAELGARPTFDSEGLQSLERTVRALEERQSAALAEASGGVSALAGRLAAHDEGRAALDARLAELTARLVEVERPAEPDPALTMVQAAVDELRVRQSAIEQLLERVDAVEARMADRTGAIELEELVGRLQAVEARIESATAADNSAELATRLAAVEARVEESSLAGARLAELESRVEGGNGSAELEPALDTLRVRIDALERRPEPVSSGQAAPSDESLAAFDARLVELERAIAQAMRSTGGAGDGSGGGVSERELDYLRVAVEGVGMRLAEQQRALAPLLRTPDIGARMDALAARVGDLLSSGLAAVVPSDGGDGQPAVGGAELYAIAARLEGIESSVRSDREKLLVQIERLASSFDWRIRRIEDGVAGDETPAP